MNVIVQKFYKIFYRISKRFSEYKFVRHLCITVYLTLFCFSKAEPKVKELTNTSTLVVKAEVYSLDSENMIKHNKEEKAVLGVMNTTNEKLFATANDIQVLGTENIELPVECEENRPNQRRIKKPKWTLRINLQCNGEAEGGNYFRKFS